MGGFAQLGRAAELVGKYVGDQTYTPSGALHVVNQQSLYALTPDLTDLDMSTYSYPGGQVYLPPEFYCENVIISVQGTLGAVTDLTVGPGCELWLSAQGTTHNSGVAGVFHFDSLTLDGGKIFRVDGNQESFITIDADTLVVLGGGLISIPYLKITSMNVTIEDGSNIVANQTQVNVTNCGNLQTEGNYARRGQGLTAGSGPTGGGHGGGDRGARPQRVDRDAVAA